MGRPRKRRREEGNSAGLGDSQLSSLTRASSGASTSTEHNLDVSEIQTYGLPFTGDAKATLDNANSDDSFMLPATLGFGSTVDFAGIDMPGLFSTDYATAPSQINPVSHDSNAAQKGCSCLEGLYSTLASFQSLPAPSFPFSLAALRKARQCGYKVVRCETCPQKYNTAVQNSMLLCTLLHLVTNEYGKLLRHIDERSQSGEQIEFRAAEPSMFFDARHTGTIDCPMAVTIELDGDEWRVLARKAVRQEVVGGLKTSESIINLVQEMRDRQLLWHGTCARGENLHDGGMHDTAANISNGKKDGHICAQLVQISNIQTALEALKI